MSSPSQYLGSQAFNQLFSADEHVVPTTGSLSLRKTLVSLRGLVADVNLEISLSYSAGTTGVLGLPPNWSFGLAYAVPGKSLTTQGKTYVIDPSWSDATGYQSGLRYMNNHGVRFQSNPTPLPLPSGRPGSYNFTLAYFDGSRDYYDGTGKLVEHADRFGNPISYFYVDQFSNVFTNRLDHVVDSFGQTVSFGYGPSSIVISTPDGSQTTLSFSPQGASVQDPLGNVTAFTYTQVAGQTVVATIDYPTGLRTQLNYVTLAGGGQAVFPAVSDHFHADAKGNILAHTSYAFGTDSGGHNFTGGFAPSTSADELMDSGNTSYIYDVLVTRLDAAGKLLAASRVYYNYLHLPLHEEHYLVESSGVSNGYRTLYTYQIDPDLHARATSYAQPTLTQQFVYSPSAADYIPLRQSTASYDDFGNIVHSEESLYDPGVQAWVSQMTATKTYVAAGWGGEMPQNEIHVDSVSGSQRQIAYTLTDDQTCIASATVLFLAAGQSGWTPWKTKSYTYDANGRVTATTLAWAPGSPPVPAGSVTSTTTTNAYSYDSATRAYAIASTDGLGNATTRSYDVGVRTGPTTHVISPLGATTVFHYDALGRATSVTDAEGKTTSTVYALAAGLNSAVTTGPTGYVVASDYDALGREVKTMDNGDPTQADGPVPNRILRQTVYDARGNVAQVTDDLGLVTRHSYDSLNRTVQTTDLLGNVSTVGYLDAAGSVSYSVGGVLRRMTQLDGLGRAVTVTDCADPDDDSITFQLRRQISYDGFSLPVGIRLDSVPLDRGSAQSLYQYTFTYDVEARIASETYVGTNGAQVTVSRTTAHDLFGHPVGYQKQTTYADGRSFQNTGSTSTYDAAGRLVAIANQLHQVERYSYDADGQLQRLTRLDGTVVTYGYDRVGRLLQVAWPGNSILYTYLANGRVATRASGDAVLRYDYSLDGTVQLITYPDGRTQSYGLDATSRVIRQTDPSGMVTSTVFNPCGQVAQRLHGGDSVTYAYGTVNHVSGVLTGDRLSGGTPATRQISYDGYGRTRATVVTDALGQVMLSAGYARDAVGRLTRLTLDSSISQDPSVNLSRQLSYDGLDQLVGSATSSSGGQRSTVVSYLYDGNFNVVGRTANGTAQSFTYNAIDQLVTGGMTYDRNGRLTADGVSGHSYTYNVLDQLTAVAVGDGSPLITYAYYPDGTLATTTVSRDISTFYHDGEHVNAIAASTVADGHPTWTTFLLDAGGRHGAYTAGQPPSYYLLSTDSTALLQQAGGPTLAFDYDPYGAVTNGAQMAAPESFSWCQEYTDPASGLVYLRARYYSPGLMRFLTMDNLTKDNRYSYCAGDPVNRVDPTGHLESSEIAGIVIGTAVSVGAAALVGPGAVAVGAAIFGSESTAVTAGAAVVAGAVSSVAGDAASAAITGQRFTAQRALIDLASGAVGGGVGSGVSDVIGHVAMTTTRSQSQAVLFAIRAVSALGGNVSGGTAAALVSSLASGQPFFSSSTALSLALGSFAGAAGDLAVSGAYLKIRTAGARSESTITEPALSRRGSQGENESLFFVRPRPRAQSLPDLRGVDFSMGLQAGGRTRSYSMEVRSRALFGHGVDNVERPGALAGAVFNVENENLFRRSSRFRSLDPEDQSGSS